MIGSAALPFGSVVQVRVFPIFFDIGPYTGDNLFSGPLASFTFTPKRADSLLLVTFTANLGVYPCCGTADPHRAGGARIVVSESVVAENGGIFINTTAAHSVPLSMQGTWTASSTAPIRFDLELGARAGGSSVSIGSTGYGGHAMFTVMEIAAAQPN